ncbi:MAG: M48 family metalloprotease [Pseudomonadota bacterium]
MAVPFPAAADTANELPDIGNPASAVISKNQEYQFGRMIMHQMDSSGVLINDPEITDYIQHLGYRLAYHGNDSEQRFTFFVVDDPSINAFALPGGFIGVHTGLIMASANENELAGVMAHEIAHVTQRHIARSIQDSSETSMLTTAAMVAALVIGGLSGAGSDAAVAALSAAQAAGIQRQINFTRANEYEADRIGIGILADAGFDPEGMGTFFETLQRRSGIVNRDLEFLRTHPVTQNRIAEARNRAARLPPVKNASSRGYGVIRERVMVLNSDSPDEALAHYRNQNTGPLSEQSDHVQYGQALALMRQGKTSDAQGIFEALLNRNETVVAYHIAAARAQLAAGDSEAGLKTFADALTLFPRNVPLTMRYAEALIDEGEANKAHRMMLDLINNVRYTTSQLRLLAMAASSAGDAGDAYYYNSEVHVLRGELALAIRQLKQALESPDLNAVQRSRFQARLDFIIENLPKKERKRLAKAGEI